MLGEMRCRRRMFSNTQRCVDCPSAQSGISIESGVSGVRDDQAWRGPGPALNEEVAERFAAWETELVRCGARLLAVARCRNSRGLPDGPVEDSEVW